MSEPQVAQVSINVARGLTSLARQFASRFPRGEMLWNNGLGDIVQAAIERHPAVPKKEIPAVELAERMGLIPKVVKRRRK